MNRKEQDQTLTEHKMPSCDDCGVVFENNHDLQTHVKSWCPRQMLKRAAPVEEDDIFTKRSRYTDHSEEMDNGSEYDSTNSDQENNVFEELAVLARKRNEDVWSQKMVKYEKDGLSVREAKQKADKKFLDADMRQFYRYTELF
ncbi:hypothetical protein ACF0H5_015030 [Mactra antiquata]